LKITTISKKEEKIMKKEFVEPEISVLKLEMEDIMASSNELRWEDEF
jgi:hypothetical protein